MTEVWIVETGWQFDGDRIEGAYEAEFDAMAHAKRLRDEVRGEWREEHDCYRWWNMDRYVHVWILEVTPASVLSRVDGEPRDDVPPTSRVEEDCG